MSSLVGLLGLSEGIHVPYGSVVRGSPVLKIPPKPVKFVVCDSDWEPLEDDVWILLK